MRMLIQIAYSESAFAFDSITLRKGMQRQSMTVSLASFIQIYVELWRRFTAQAG